MSLDTVPGLRVIQLVNDGAIGTLVSRRAARDAPESAAIQVKTYFVAAALVERGLGVAVMDEFTARACATPEMDFRPLTEPLRFEVIGIHLEDRPLSKVMRHFLDAVGQALAAGKA